VLAAEAAVPSSEAGVELPVAAEVLLEEPPEREIEETPPSEASVKSLCTVCEMVPVAAVEVR